MKLARSRSFPPHVRIMDLEITNSNPDRSLWIDPGISMNIPDCEIIGCYIHDLHNSGVNWQGGGIGRVAECWISQNGDNEGGVGYGHGIYTHNNTGGARVIERNLFDNQYGRYTIHIYSGGQNWLQDYTCQNNVIFGDSVHIGGGLGVKALVYQNNIQYGDYVQIGRYSPEGENYDAIIQNNLFIDLYNYQVDPFQQLTNQNNVAWGDTGFTTETMPANWSQFIPFSLSERWAGIQCSIVSGEFSAAIINK